MERSSLIVALGLLAFLTVSLPGCSNSPAGAAGANTVAFNANIQAVCPNNALCVDAGQQIVLNAVAPVGGAVRVSQADALHPEAVQLAVTWKIVAGPGSLTNETSTSATFQAPPAAQLTGPAMTTIMATSTTNSSQTGTVTITTNLPPTVTTTSLTAATEFSAVSGEQLNASGGSGRKIWALAGGTAPPNGLTLNADGSITGTPSGPKGNFNFQVTVTDDATPPLTSPAATVSIAINWPPAPTISPASLPSAPTNSNYSQTITVSQGHAPYTLAFSTAPPADQGLSYAFTSNNSASASLAITGTPTVAAGTVINFTLQVTDSSTPAQVVQFPLSITVTSGASALAITTTSPLPGANLSEMYSTMITASGGAPPYNWTLSASSTLPPGFSPLASGTPSGTLSGTPTATGTFKFTVQVADSASTVVSATFLLTVTGSSTLNCPGTVNLTLCGFYAYGISGYNSSSGVTAFGGGFSADNAGHVIAGEQARNDSVTNFTSVTITGGNYVMDASGDGRGVLTLIDSTAASVSFRFVLESSANPGTAPLIQFDNSGDIAEGLLLGPETPPIPQIPANAFISVDLDGVDGAGQLASLLGLFKVGATGCDGSAGSFNSVGNFVTNTAGTVNTSLTATGTCSAPDANGVGTLRLTISGGTPFTDSTLHFDYIVTGSGGTFAAFFLLGTDLLADNQPILTGEGTPNTVAGTVTPSVLASFCPCLFQSLATTDGTVTTGKSDAAIVRVAFTAGAGNSGTVSGVIDENAGGTITSQGAWPYTAFTIDTNGTGTITGAGQKTIHFIVGDVLYTLDESTLVKTGSMNMQNATAIQSPGEPYIFGADEAAINKAKSVPRMSGVLTPSGASSGSLTGTVDVVDTAGQMSGAAASGNYMSISSTTGRGTGSANLTGTSAVNIVFYAFRGRRFLVLDVQSSNPFLTGARLQ